jgi:hypothetical protein
MVDFGGLRLEELGKKVVNMDYDCKVSSQAIK